MVKPCSSNFRVITAFVLDVRFLGFLRQPKILAMWFYHRVACLKDEIGMANRVDPDQTAPSGYLIWVYTACTDMSVLLHLSDNLGLLP